MIDRLKETGDNRIWIINSDKKLEDTETPIHYFKSIVEKALPVLDDEQQEERKIRKSILKLGTILNGGEGDE
jgi:hypothetical protein